VANSPAGALIAIPAGSLVTTKANPKPVGRPASINRTNVMLKLSIELELSYKQVMNLALTLLMLFPG